MDRRYGARASGIGHRASGIVPNNAARDTIDIGGHELERSKKFRDVARTGRAAIMIDDRESTEPRRPRAIGIRGRAEAIALPTPLIRIHPERIVSCGLARARSSRTVARQALP
jgi:pyridoxamine 5'-phosphate oxidase family protein